jgi:O-methyltransferase involved in polyketide biosynthesis
MEAFLEAHPGRVTVLHVCMRAGLEELARQVAGRREGVGQCRQADVTELRRQVMGDPAAESGAVYRLIDPSITEDGWLETCQIPTDRPVVVIMEGLTMYLAPDEVWRLLRQITGYFLGQDVHGEIYFDAAGTMTVRTANKLGGLRKLGTSLKWALSGHMELEKEVPGLEFQDDIGFSKIIKHEAFRAGHLGLMTRNVIYGLTFLWPSTWAVGIYSYRF